MNPISRTRAKHRAWIAAVAASARVAGLQVRLDGKRWAAQIRNVALRERIEAERIAARRVQLRADALAQWPLEGRIGRAMFGPNGELLDDWVDDCITGADDARRGKSRARGMDLVAIDQCEDDE